MRAGNIIKFSDEQLQATQDIYEHSIKPHIHDYGSLINVKHLFLNN